MNIKAFRRTFSCLAFIVRRSENREVLSVPELGISILNFESAVKSCNFQERQNGS